MVEDAEAEDDPVATLGREGLHQIGLREGYVHHAGLVRRLPGPPQSLLGEIDGPEANVREAASLCPRTSCVP
jgi:hypothetical protein